MRGFVGWAVGTGFFFAAGWAFAQAPDPGPRVGVFDVQVVGLPGDQVTSARSLIARLLHELGAQAVGEPAGLGPVEATCLEQPGCLIARLAGQEVDGAASLRLLRAGSMLQVRLRWFDAHTGTLLHEAEVMAAKRTFPQPEAFERGLRTGLDILRRRLAARAAPDPVVAAEPKPEPIPKEPVPLAPAPVDPPPPKSPGGEVATPAPHGASDQVLWGWTSVGVGAALLAAGAVTGGLALSENGELADACPGGLCSPGDRSAIQRRDDLALSADVLIPVGAAALLTGILLLALDDGPAQVEPDGLSLEAGIGPGGVGLRGRF